MYLISVLISIDFSFRTFIASQWISEARGEDTIAQQWYDGQVVSSDYVACQSTCDTVSVFKTVVLLILLLFVEGFLHNKNS